MRHLLIFLLLCGMAFADVTISGTQTRGRGTDGKLRCTGVRLPDGGVIVRAADSGAGFWLESNTGGVVRFDNAREAAGTSLPAGTWCAYPNLLKDQDEASVSVVIGTGGAAATGTAAGVWAWFANGDVTFRSDGTLVQDKLTGRWTQSGSRVNVVWSHGCYDFLTLSADGRQLRGYGSHDPKATSGFAVSGNRKGTNTAGTAASATAAGVWAWFANGDVTFRADGTLVQGNLTGRWTQKGSRVNVMWSHGYYDFLTLSPDGRKLSGYGSQNPTATTGFAVSGNRK